MLVKVKKRDNKWVMFDNAEEVHYDKAPNLFNSRDDLERLISDVVYTLILPSTDLDKIGKDNPLLASVISFQHFNEQHIVVFTTIAYICNDDGRTVERVNGV